MCFIGAKSRRRRHHRCRSCGRRSRRRRRRRRKRRRRLPVGFLEAAAQSLRVHHLCACVIVTSSAAWLQNYLKTRQPALIFINVVAERHILRGAHPRGL